MTVRLIPSPLRLLDYVAAQGHTYLPATQAAVVCQQAGINITKSEVDQCVADGSVVVLHTHAHGRVLARTAGARAARTGAAWVSGALAREKAAQAGSGLALDSAPAADMAGLAGLAPAQQAALLRGLSSIEPFALTGGPGTGKTHVTALLVQQLRRQGHDVSVAAPTGKAAEVCARKIKSETSTIHQLLSWVPGRAPRVDRYSPWLPGTYVLDESSMDDEEMFGHICSAMTAETRLILVGDPHQIPPVGAGQPFADLLAAGFSRVHLEQVWRQAQGSRILDLAYDIQAGHVHRLADYHDGGVEAWNVSPKAVEKKTIDYWRAYLKPRPYREWLILSPYRASVESMNKQIQTELAAEQQRVPVTGRSDSKFFIGDRIIFSVNDYTLGYVNGSMGTITDAELRGDGMNARCHVTVLADDGTEYHLPYAEFKGDAELAYACTIHKAQGSEAQEVVLSIPVEESRILSRPLLYTAVTRAAQQLTILAPFVALERAAAHLPKRRTLLSLLLAEPDVCDQISETKITDMSYLYE